MGRRQREAAVEGQEVIVEGLTVFVKGAELTRSGGKARTRIRRPSFAAWSSMPASYVAGSLRRAVYDVPVVAGEWSGAWRSLRYLAPETGLWPVVLGSYVLTEYEYGACSGEGGRLRRTA